MRAVALLLWVALGAAGAAGQEVASGARVQAYALGEGEGFLVRSLTLVTLPVHARVPLGSSLALSVNGGFASARASLRNGESTRMSGPVDTRVAMELSRGAWVVTGVAALPTGSVVSSLDEAALVGLMSTDVLPFAVTQWGAGGGFAADVGYGFQSADLSFRLSAGGSLTTGSTLLGAGGSTLDPGRQVRARLGIDAPTGEAGIASILVGFQRFTADAYQGQSIFTAGSRWEVVGTYAFPMGVSEGGLVYGGVYHLGRAASDLGANTLAALGNAVVGVGGRAPRTTFLGGTELRVRRGAVLYAPRADLRFVRSQDGVGQGWLGSVGGRMEWDRLARVLGGQVRLEPTLMLRLGGLVGAMGERTRVVGWEAGATLRWEGGR